MDMEDSSPTVPLETREHGASYRGDQHMPIAKTQAGQPPVWNLQFLLVGASLVFYAWWWANFSGPFRLLVDVELKFFGSYSEPATAVALLVAMLPVIALPAALLGRAYADLSEAAANVVATAVFVVASIAALGQCWHLWHVAGQMPRPSDPVQVFDLGRIGNAPPPTGHVRLIGTPDHARQVLIQSTGRRSLGSYWEAWVPVTARSPRDSITSFRIVATHRASDPADAANAVTDDPEGVLLANSLDTRTMYEVRQEGLDLAEHSFVLYPDDQVQFDRFISAALLGFLVVLFWTLAAYSKIKERRSGITPEARVAASPPGVDQAPTVAPVDASVVPAPKPIQPTDGLLTRVGIRAAVASTLAGGALWEVFGFHLTVVQLLAYLAAVLAFGVSGLLIWFGQRHDDATQEAAHAPTGVATMARVSGSGEGSAASECELTQSDVDHLRVNALRALYGQLSAADCSTWLAKGWIRRVEDRNPPIRVRFLRSPSFMWTDPLIPHLERLVIWSEAAEQPDGFIGVVLMVVPKGGAFLSHIAHVVPDIRGSAEQAATDAETVVRRWLTLNATLTRRV